MPCSTQNELFQQLEIDYVRVYRKSSCGTSGDIVDSEINVIDIVVLVENILDNQSDVCFDLIRIRNQCS